MVYQARMIDLNLSPEYQETNLQISTSNDWAWKGKKATPRIYHVVGDKQQELGYQPTELGYLTITGFKRGGCSWDPEPPEPPGYQPSMDMYSRYSQGTSNTNGDSNRQLAKLGISGEWWRMRMWWWCNTSLDQPILTSFFQVDPLAKGHHDLGMDQYLLIPFLGEWPSINPSYFDVNYRGTIGFDTLPFFWCSLPSIHNH